MGPVPINFKINAFTLLKSYFNLTIFENHFILSFITSILDNFSNQVGLHNRILTCVLINFKINALTYYIHTFIETSLKIILLLQTAIFNTSILNNFDNQVGLHNRILTCVLIIFKTNAFTYNIYTFIKHI